MAGNLVPGRGNAPHQTRGVLRHPAENEEGPRTPHSASTPRIRSVLASTRDSRVGQLSR